MINLPMNKFPILIYISIFSVVYRCYFCKPSPEYDEQLLYSIIGDNLFRSVNNDLQQAVNKLFSSLKLNVNFSEQYETRMLLSIFASLKGVSEKTYDDIKQVKKISRLDKEFLKFQNNSLFKLDAPIEEIMTEDFQTNKTNNKSVRQLNVKFRTNSIEVPDDSKEAVILLREHLINNQNIELADIEQPSRKIKLIYENHKQFRRSSNRNFKLWDPTNPSDFEFDTRRVYDGKQVKTKKYPFVVSIHVRNQFVCSGAIISRDLVITAASCLNLINYNPNYLQEYPPIMVVRVGSDRADKFGDVIDVINFFVNPKYEENTLRNNIAILKIKKHVHLRSKTHKIRRIGYQHLKASLPDSVNEVLLLGWGEEGETPAKKNMKDVLSISTLGLMKNINDCINIYTPNYVTDKNFCAGLSENGTGACQHDIGGPAVVSSVLVGIVSFGPLICGTPNAPTVFTNIGYYSDWIDSIVALKKQVKHSKKHSNLHDILRLGTDNKNTPSSTHKASKIPQHFTVAGDALEYKDSDYTLAIKSEEMIDTTNSPLPNRTPTSQLLQTSTTASPKKISPSSIHPSSEPDYLDFPKHLHNAIEQLSLSLVPVLSNNDKQRDIQLDVKTKVSELIQNILDNKTLHELVGLKHVFKTSTQKGPEMLFDGIEDQNEFRNITDPTTLPIKNIIRNDINEISNPKQNLEVDEDSTNDSGDSKNDEGTSEEQPITLNTLTIGTDNLSEEKLHNLLTVSTSTFELSDEKNSKVGLPKVEKDLKKIAEDILKNNFVKGDLSLMNGNHKLPKNIKLNDRNIKDINKCDRFNCAHQKTTTRKRLHQTVNKFRHLNTPVQMHRGIYSEENVRKHDENFNKKEEKSLKQDSDTPIPIEDLEREIVKKLKSKKNIRLGNKELSTKSLASKHTGNKGITFSDTEVSRVLKRRLKLLKQKAHEVEDKQSVKEKFDRNHYKRPAERQSKQIRKENERSVKKKIGRNQYKHPAERKSKKSESKRHTVHRERFYKPTPAHMNSEIIKTTEKKLIYLSNSQSKEKLNSFNKSSIPNISKHPYYEDIKHSFRNNKNSKSVEMFNKKIIKDFENLTHYTPAHAIDYYYYLPSLEGGMSTMKDFHEVLEEIENGGKLQ